MPSLIAGTHALDMGSANERRRYYVSPYLIGLAIPRMISGMDNYNILWFLWDVCLRTQAVIVVGSVCAVVADIGVGAVSTVAHITLSSK